MKIIWNEEKTKKNNNFVHRRKTKNVETFKEPRTYTRENNELYWTN